MANSVKSKRYGQAPKAGKAPSAMGLPFGSHRTGKGLKRKTANPPR